MTLPLYGEFGVEHRAPRVGAGFTLSVRYISRLAPQPCGMPYIWPFTEFHGLFFRTAKMSA